MTIAYQVNYFPKLPFLVMNFLKVANNEVLAFWALLDTLTKPWVMPFFSKQSIFGSAFHLHMISNIIQDQFPALSKANVEYLLLGEAFKLYELYFLLIFDIFSIVFSPH